MKYRVVLHIDEIKKWKKLINNIKNLIKDLGKEVEIRVVANGEAVKYYDKTENLDQKIEDLEKLSKENVVFTACNNALIGNKVERENLYEFVEIVSAGVGELTKRQSEGFGYIKV